MKPGVSRRSFLGFFLLGGFIGLFRKNACSGPRERKAMFWRKKNEA